MVGNTASDKNNLNLASVAGTYEGTFPAADGSGIKTVLTIKADGTYQIEQDYIDQKDGMTRQAEYSKYSMTMY